MAVECTVDLTQDADYNLIINKDRDLNQEIVAEVYSGETYVTTFSFSGYSGATLTVKVKPQDAYSVLNFDTADGSIVLGLNGVFALVKSATELANIKAGEFYYNMYLRSSTQSKRAFLSGKFIVVQNVG